ncbi:tripartite motif-containing protein 2-like [Mytilus edulis]|uniref:tripartite motif-containing protein 2-like n=1 Tax=Mytilus edulis TaxID=6550 RepID=UPI0039F09CEA
MAMSRPQVQCPIQCQLCEGEPKVKWKCLDCDLLMCSKCKDKVHSKFKSEKDHRIIDIKDIGQQSKGVYQQDKKNTSQPELGVPSPPTNVKLINIKEYKTKMLNIRFLAVSLDGSLWIGDGDMEKGFHLFTSHTALQNVKLVGDKVKVISSFNIEVCDIAVSPTNDILLATGEKILKQIKAGSNKVSDSVYFVELSYIKSVHVTKDGRVIVGRNKVVIVMDTDGNHLTRYMEDKNNKPIFDGNIWCITSTLNGNIFVAKPYSNNPRVVVLGKGDAISYYTGHPSINRYNAFWPEAVITTPMDNVIVADFSSHTLHILDNTGHLLTIYNTKDRGIEYPRSLAITMEGNFAVLYIGCRNTGSCEDSSDTGRLYKMNIIGC